MSFSAALRGALREDPDVILVGEMRDLETISLALTAAETGHLVFGTLHTSSAPKTVDRIIDVFPAAQQEQIRIMFSESIQAVITQTLLKKRAGGRIAALEILIGTPAVRNLIREGKIHQIPSAMQTGQKVGMQTLDMALIELVRRNQVTVEEAQSRTLTPNLFASNAVERPAGAAAARRAHRRCARSAERRMAASTSASCSRRWSSAAASDLYVTVDSPPVVRVEGVNHIRRGRAARRPPRSRRWPTR